MDPAQTASYSLVLCNYASLLARSNSIENGAFHPREAAGRLVAPFLRFVLFDGW